MSIRLVKMSATCKLCGHKVHQIDTSKAHARQVIDKAILKHLTEAHPCSCGDRNRPNINHRKRIPCWTYVGRVRHDIDADGRVIDGGD